MAARYEATFSDDERADQNDSHLDVMPSCIESLASSAEQLQQLAADIGQYYIKTLISYGCTHQNSPSRASSSPTATREEYCANNEKDNGNKGDRRRPFEYNAAATAGRLDRQQSTAKATEHQKLDLNEVSTELVESMGSLLAILPFLDELSSFIERCFATLESTLKRSTYHLNKAASKSSTATGPIEDSSEFQLTPDTTIHPIFVALMDLFYGLVSLDETIQTHTNIRRNLAEFKTLCQLVVETPDSADIPDDLRDLPRQRLMSLVSFIGNIQLTLCNESRTIFQQCLEHIQHLNLILSKDKTNKGYKNLREHFEDFLLFFGDNLIEPTTSIDSREFNRNPKLIRTKTIYLLNLNLTPALCTAYSVPRKVFGLASLLILYSWLFKRQDKRVSKMFALIPQKHKTDNLVPLLGSNCYLLLSELLSKHLPKSYLDSKVMKQLCDQGELLLKLSTASELDRLSMKVIPWLVKFKAETSNNNNSTNLSSWDGSERADFAHFRGQIQIIQHGLALIEEINHVVRSITAAYANRGRPMTRDKLIPLLRSVSLLKSIEVSLRRSKLFVYNCAIQIEYSARARWRKLMGSARKRLVLMGYSDRKLDTNSALTLVSICSRVDLLTSARGRAALSLCLSMLISSLDTNEVDSINDLLALMVSDTYEQLELSANCGFLYWSSPAFSAYYNHSFEEDPCAIGELQYFHLALDDIRSLLSARSQPARASSVDLSWLAAERDEFITKLGAELMDQFKSDFLDKICQEFEIELRLQIYRDLNLEGHNPFKRHLYNFKQIFADSNSNMTFKIFNQQVSLRCYVEQHLNKICYNLTAIAPHDWFIYDSILNLARHKFNLKFVNSQLPSQTLDAGLDLIDITRNLALFVQRYSYDLINQSFVEKCTSQSRLSTGSMAASSMISGNAGSSANQWLNVVQVRHIARSIQTHGYGLLNSSVNCTYQLMKRLMNLFSKQIADDKLRAILAKEHQQLMAAATASSSTGRRATMSFERATRMTKRLRSSVTSSMSSDSQQLPVGSLDLDSIRQSVSQLGNALAFIRMLKSGALNCASESANYLPELDNLTILRLSKLVSAEFAGFGNTRSLAKAARNFDQCLADYDENFSPKTNYFNIIIGIFAKILSSEAATATGASAEPARPTGAELNANAETTTATSQPSAKQGEPARRDHLRLFFVLVPSLTMNYIDYIINCKERVLSRSSAARFGALISDDGFSMGVAFLLTVLAQENSFAGLEWFRQVRLKLAEDKREVEQRCEDSRYEESLRQTSSMTLRRLQRLRTEYEALEYTLSSALLFFRSSTFGTTMQHGGSSPPQAANNKPASSAGSTLSSAAANATSPTG